MTSRNQVPTPRELLGLFLDGISVHCYSLYCHRCFKTSEEMYYTAKNGDTMSGSVDLAPRPDLCISSVCTYGLGTFMNSLTPVLAIRMCPQLCVSKTLPISQRSYHKSGCKLILSGVLRYAQSAAIYRVHIEVDIHQNT